MQRLEAILTHRVKGSGSLKCMQSFIQIGSGINKLMVEDIQTGGQYLFLKIR
jgi:hypothetical protein